MLCVKIINRLIREQSVPWSEGNTFTLTGCAITPARIWRQLALHGSLQGIILNLHDTSTFASLSLANPVPNWCKVRANATGPNPRLKKIRTILRTISYADNKKDKNTKHAINKTK